VSEGTRLLRAADRPAVAWKNGGGVTSEVAAEPPGSDLAHFDWRVSIARVEAPGPFSVFPGIERRLAVLEGALELAIDGRPPLALRANGPALVFSGEAPVSARPLGGPVTDLNVMTRIGRYAARLELRRAEAGALEALAPVCLLIALSELRLSAGGEELRLARLDALRVAAGASLRFGALQAADDFWWIEIRTAAR
jgi:environmental stress-induced protein Ves